MTPSPLATPLQLKFNLALGALMGNTGLFGFAAFLVLLRTALYGWLAKPFGGLVAASCHFDCDFYLRIAASGYGVDAQFHDRGAFPNWAYFPLFPLLVRLSNIILGSLPLAGIAVTTTALIAFAGLGALYVRQVRPEPKPILWLLLVCATPFGFYFSIPYTEALFAALAMGVLWARAAQRPVLAAICAALASGCRPTGILLSLVVVADQIVLLCRMRRDVRAAGDWTRALLPIAIAPLGLSLFMAWQYRQVGDGMAFSHVQVIWDRRWLGPITWLRLGLRQDDWGNVAALFPAQSYSFNAACAIASLLAACWLASRRRWAEAWICGSLILLPLSSGLHSMPRFVGTNPAVLLVVYDLLRLVRWAARTSLLLLLAACQIALLVAWFRHADGLF